MYLAKKERWPWYRVRPPQRGNDERRIGWEKMGYLRVSCEFLPLIALNDCSILMFLLHQLNQIFIFYGYESHSKLIILWYFAQRERMEGENWEWELFSKIWFCCYLEWQQSNFFAEGYYGFYSIILILLLYRYVGSFPGSKKMKK